MFTLRVVAAAGAGLGLGLGVAALVAGGGAGLGLAIAKEIVCAHGGTVACESTPEHTIFTIELPAA